MGGGKSIIIGDPSKKTPALLKRYGEFVAELKGGYVTAKDVGITSADLKIVKTRTSNVLGIDGEQNSSGDPSPLTAWGVFNGMKACVEQALGKTSFSGVTVALQGLGAVNYYLAQHLAKDGAKLIGCDIDMKAIDRARSEFSIEIVDPEKIYDANCDVFSPGALGASVNEKTIPRIRARVIAGAANNQLATPADGHTLFAKKVVYAPDYAINAGGLINIFHEREGYNRDRAWSQVAGIYGTIKDILTRAEKEKVPTHEIADKIALERVNDAEKNRSQA
jgi:leucine dehydrogenase